MMRKMVIAVLMVASVASVSMAALITVSANAADAGWQQSGVIYSWTAATGGDNRKVAVPPGGEFVIGADQRATPLPPDSFDLTDYITLYCIMDAQAETQAEEEADGAE